MSYAFDNFGRPEVKHSQLSLVEKIGFTAYIGMKPLACHISDHNYTPNGYIVPAEFCVHFLPRMKNVPKRTKMHLNEIGLTNHEICKRQIQLRQPPISWKNVNFRLFATRE